MNTLKLIWGFIKLHYILILVVIGIISLVVISIPIIKENNIKNDLYQRYMNGTLFQKETKTADSLKAVVKIQQDIISKNNVALDSLYKAKANKTITYETNIQNFSNPSIVSDDSITRYISKKIHN